MISCSKERLQDKIETFSKFGDTGTGGITRLSLSKEALEARAEFVNRCKKLGLEVKTDDMANIYAIRKGEEDLPAIVMGSHMDSVANGGNYDGILGVLAGLEVVETIVTENIKTRHPIAVMVWTNEEGSRFDPAMMSSGVVTGKFEKEKMLLSKDTDGVTFGEALDASGYKGDEANRLSAKNYAGYFEMHIEQGPVLELANKEIGIVQGVVGMVNYEIEVLGVSDHAGTTPQHTRKDALYAATKIIGNLWDKLCVIDPELVFTFGRINASPNIHTVIPKEVKFTLDARHKDPEVLEQVVKIIKELEQTVEKCSVSYKQLWGRETIQFDSSYIQAVEDSTKTLGYTYQDIYSGAGHDAQYVADVLPSTMIFVPSVDGHSHCVEEHTPVEACLKGTNVMLHAVLEIDKN